MTSAATRPADGRSEAVSPVHHVVVQPQVPGQRQPDPSNPSSPAPSGWEDYCNAGPDVYWPPDRPIALS